MPRVIITAGAAQGLERCRQFLAEKNPQAARRAGQTIARTFEFLESDPELGRPFDDIPELRELVIEFGDAGYVALYQYNVETNSVYILAFRHQKKAGY
ncbi:type II toxin-antitoxin system RelE/ParE family toxin [Methylomonas sp. AM2-LC]|uniref:type II toxin-antitoxin system RelE/ParE family toxin n=1 Tax=Methylomonas sp. AM2-LC TaxID=3153301 RepID=UPI003265C19B